MFYCNALVSGLVVHEYYLKFTLGKVVLVNSSVVDINNSILVQLIWVAVEFVVHGAQQ